MSPVLPFQQRAPDNRLEAAVQSLEEASATARERAMKTWAEALRRGDADAAKTARRDVAALVAEAESASAFARHERGPRSQFRSPLEEPFFRAQKAVRSLQSRAGRPQTTLLVACSIDSDLFIGAAGDGAAAVACGDLIRFVNPLVSQLDDEGRLVGFVGGEDRSLRPVFMRLPSWSTSGLTVALATDGVAAEAGGSIAYLAEMLQHVRSAARDPDRAPDLGHFLDSSDLRRDNRAVAVLADANAVSFWQGPERAPHAPQAFYASRLGGKPRQEDCCDARVRGRAALAVVADGVGSTPLAAAASGVAVAAVVRWFEENLP